MAKSQGEWIPIVSGYEIFKNMFIGNWLIWGFKCSICDYEMEENLYMKKNFCPNCGAKMKWGKTNAEQLYHSHKWILLHDTNPETVKTFLLGNYIARGCAGEVL